MIEDCCNCKHFRMFKPMSEYCTIKKARVEPLLKRNGNVPVSNACKDFSIRANLRGM